MATHLLLAPAASGKTDACIRRVRSVLQAVPLAEVWVVLADRHQADTFRRRLGHAGGVLGARVGTFSDLHTEILARAGISIPVAPPAVVHRLVRAAIDAVAERGCLRHYGAIRQCAGFAGTLVTWIAELKRTGIGANGFATAVQGRGPQLEELASLYREYENALSRLQWTDPQGLGSLAVQVLSENQSVPLTCTLLIADGFDSFNRTQLETLRLLARQTDELLLTLSGTRDMARQAHRRFARTLEEIKAALAPEIEPFEPHTRPVPALAHLEARLFESDSQKMEPGKTVSFLEAQTIALEAREALRWIKARVWKDGVPAGDCAVIGYDLTPYRPFLREAGNEFGIPLRFAGGEPLANNPLIAAILNLLELALKNWARRPLLDALRTPYFDLSAFGLGKREAKQLDLVAHWGQVIQSLDQWQDALQRLAKQPDSLPNLPFGNGEDKGEDFLRDDSEDAAAAPPLPRGKAARDLWSKLAVWAHRVTPPTSGRLEVFVNWVEDLLADAGGFRVWECAKAQVDTELRDLAALVEFKGVLRALVLGERIVGERAELSYADFCNELRAGVETAEYNPDDPRPLQEGRVYVADLQAARGVSYRAVAVLGLSEGLFPQPLREDPLLSDRERDSLRACGLPLEPHLRSDQQTLFYEAVTRAGEYLLLTRPYLADDGESWDPSPYWNAACALFDAKPIKVRPDELPVLPAAASKLELFTGAVRARALPAAYAHLKPEWEGLRHAGTVLRARVAHEPKGEFEGDIAAVNGLLSALYGPQEIWSSSRLETFGACPFRFFFESALDLKRSETPKEGFDPAQLGSMLHEILEKVYQAVSDPMDINAVVDALPGVASEVFDAAPEKYGFRPTLLWAAERAEHLAQLEKTLRGLAEEAGDFRPVCYEARFGFGHSLPLTVETCIGQVLFHGVIDRVDRNSQGEVRVIDYKTGASHLNPRDLGEGQRLQIVLYALAAEEVLQVGRAVDGLYWAIRKAEAGALRLSTFEYKTKEGYKFQGLRDAEKLVRNYVGDYVGRIRAGQFPPLPPRNGCPKYCAAQSACWRYVPSDNP